MNPYPYQPGIPAAGHIAHNGWWHPGPVRGCVKCPPVDCPYCHGTGQTGEDDCHRCRGRGKVPPS